MFLDYLKGLVVLIGLCSWIVFFNWGWWKLTKEKLWEEDHPLAAIIMPFLMPMAASLILLLPLILWRGI